MDSELDFSKTEESAKKTILGISKKYQERIYKATEQSKPKICHIMETHYSKRTVVQASFLTRGCQMKKGGSCWNCNYGALESCEITPEQYIEEFKKALEHISGNVLVLEGLGSITDPNEFDQGAFREILKLAIDKGKFRTITIETHVTQISEELLQYINSINNGKKDVEFEIGVEDMNPEARKLINKLGVDNNKIKEIYELCQRYGIGLDINLIYGFPFMIESERIDSVINSIKQVHRNLPNAEVTLFLMSIKENTILKYMYDMGVYKKPNPWGFIEVTKKVLEDDELKDMSPPTFSWFGEKEIPSVSEELCYTCQECMHKIIEALKQINGTFDNEERKAILNQLIESNEDGCYQEFLKSLEEEKDGKTPKERYRSFMQNLSTRTDNSTVTAPEKKIFSDQSGGASEREMEID